jgi:hypothetical protein
MINNEINYDNMKVIKPINTIFLKNRSVSNSRYYKRHNSVSNSKNKIPLNIKYNFSEERDNYYERKNKSKNNNK